jgi:hypothetical protein
MIREAKSEEDGQGEKKKKKKRGCVAMTAESEEEPVGWLGGRVVGGFR